MTRFKDVIVVFAALLSFSSAKELHDVPGLNFKLNFRHHTGYLDASEHHHIFYWFVESQNDPEKDPLVLWLNGGPGCSSMSGLMEELGPFIIKDDGLTFKRNPYAWNREANVLFIESPAGVGHSYSDNGFTVSNDDRTSLHNYQALQDFFAKFPKYRNHDFFITGESYGGIYIPTLSSRILDGMDDFKINYKGMAIGNGLLSNSLNADATMLFSYSHGLIGEKLWETIQTSCCNGCADTCSFSNLTTGFCNYYMDKINLMIIGGGLNPYDLYRDCYRPPELANIPPSTRYLATAIGLTSKRVSAKFRNMAVQQKMAIDEEILEQATNIQELLMARDKINEKEINAEEDIVVVSDPTCTNETAITNYMNRPIVRKLLGVSDKIKRKWSVCRLATVVSYQKQYEDVFAQMKQAIKANIRILLYYGDTDMACNFLMGQKFAEQLNLPVLEGKRPWIVNNQVAGLLTRYKGLDFATIKGAGHMAPGWKAPQNFYLIDRFFKNQNY